jgi:DNA-binding GntR family transcriptional regulator
LWPELAQNLDAPELTAAPLTPVQVIDEVGYNVEDQPILHSIEYYPGRFMSFDLVRRRGKYSPPEERRK